MIIGGIWYGPLFGKTQRQMMGGDTMTSEQHEAMKKAMGKMYALQFLLSLITAIVLDYFIMGTPVIVGVAVSVIIWFGFILTTIGGSALWSGKPKAWAWKMFFISSGAQLITFVVYALIITAFK